MPYKKAYRRTTKRMDWPYLLTTSNIGKQRRISRQVKQRRCKLGLTRKRGKNRWKWFASRRRKISEPASLYKRRHHVSSSARRALQNCGLSELQCTQLMVSCYAQNWLCPEASHCARRALMRPSTLSLERWREVCVWASVPSGYEADQLVHQWRCFRMGGKVCTKRAYSVLHARTVYWQKTEFCADQHPASAMLNFINCGKRELGKTRLMPFYAHVLLRRIHFLRSKLGDLLFWDQAQS